MKILEKQITRYITSDEVEHNSLKEAKKHQDKLDDAIDQRIEHGFKIGDIVYVVRNHFVSTCKIIEVSVILERVYYYEVEHFDLFHYVTKDSIKLYDLTVLDKVNETPVITYIGTDINYIKKSFEFLVATVPF